MFGVVLLSVIFSHGKGLAFSHLHLKSGLPLFCFSLELVVDPWIAGLWAALSQEFASRKEDPGYCDKTASLRANIEYNIEHLKLEDLAGQNGILSKSEGKVNPAPPILNSQPSLSQSVPPLSQSALNVPALSLEYLEVEFQENISQESSPVVRALLIQTCTFLEVSE